MAKNERILDGGSLTLYSTDNVLSGTIMLDSNGAIKLSGGANGVTISTGNIIFGGADVTIGGTNSSIAIGKTGDTILFGSTISAMLVTTLTVGTSARIPMITSSTAINVMNNGDAQGMNMGKLLVSDTYTDVSKVPTNGIYSKGNISTDGTLTTTGNATVGGVGYINGETLSINNDHSDADSYLYLKSRNTANTADWDSYIRTDKANARLMTSDSLQVKGNLSTTGQVQFYDSTGVTQYGYFSVDNTGLLKYGTNKVYHEGNKPTPADIGAQAADNDLTAIAGLTGTNGWLKKTAADTWVLEPCLTANTTIYVSSTGNDTTGDGSSTTPYQTIPKALSILPKDLGGYTATINAPVSSDAITVSGFKNGILSIIGNSSPYSPIGNLVTSAISVWDCPARVKIRNYAIGSAASQTGIDNRNSILDIQNCTIGGRSAAIVSQLDGVTTVQSVGGAGNAYGFYAMSGGRIYVSSCTLVAATLYTQNTGGIIFNNSIPVSAQPFDADLTAIAALAETSGYLKKTGENTWELESSTGGVNITEQEFVATAEQTLFTLSSTEYTLNTGTLEIFVNGIKQPADSFTETSTTSFTMNAGMEEGDFVIARVYSITAVIVPDLTTYEDVFTAEAGQTVFNLVNGSYSVGKNRLEIFINGVRQMATAFTETSSTSFTLDVGLEAGDVVIAKYYWTTSVRDAAHAATHLPGGGDAIPLATTTTDGLMSAADKVALNNAPTTSTALMKTGGTMTGALSFSNPASGAISFAIGSANCAYIYYDGSFAIAKSSVGLSIDIASDRTVNFPVNATINGNQIYHAGNKPSNNYGWKLRQSYTTAGTTTWIAPDLYNGASYEAGIFIIGGGGGGAIAAICTSSYYGSAVATGGASGYSTTLIMSVTPGTSYSVVVGTGGPSVTATGATSSGNGYAGGTSSFNGVTAAGGQGGYAATSGGSATAPIKGASGGQGSDARDYSSIASAAPANGQATSPVYSNGLYYGGATTPSMCFNSFTLKKCLGAGGGASGYNGNLGGVTAQTTITLDDGLVAGAGATSGSGASVTAGNATSPGCGGGAAISVAYSNLTPTVTSGAGKDGGVYIYTRMAVV